MFLPRAASSTPGYFRTSAKGAGGKFFPALVEPQAVTLRIRTGRLFETWLVDQAKVVPAGVTAELEARGRRNCLEKIDYTCASHRKSTPQPGVTASPHQPRISALDFFGG